MFKFPDKPSNQCTIDALPAYSDGSYQCSLKMDGYRMIATRTAEGWDFRSRENIVLVPDASLDLPARLDVFPVGSVLDGELSGWRKGDRVHRATFFDMAQYGDQPLYAETLRTRWGCLLSLPASMLVETSPDAVDAFTQWQLSQPHAEGIVLKRWDSTLIWSVRKCAAHPHWIKAKWR